MNAKLHTHLSASGLTQRAFAKALDVREATVSDWLNDKAIPRPETMKHVERVTNGAVPVSSWFDEPSEGAA